MKGRCCGPWSCSCRWSHCRASHWQPRKLTVRLDVIGEAKIETYIRCDLELLQQGVVRGFWILAEQILIKHCLDFLLCNAELFGHVILLAELAEDLESSSLRPTAVLAIGFGWQVWWSIGHGQFLKKHSFVCCNLSGWTGFLLRL